MELEDPVLRPGVRARLGRNAKPPRPTKHMKKNNSQIIDRNLYLGRKKPLPNITPLDLKIKRNLVDIHNTENYRTSKGGQWQTLRWENCWWL